jgi:hypothetical protein
VDSDIFNKTILLAVILNTISLGMEGIHLSKGSQDLRYNSSICFTYIFIVEMALKLVGMGISGIFFHPPLTFSRIYQGYYEPSRWLCLHGQYFRNIFKHRQLRRRLPGL